jgi:hypothetical protein
MNRLSIAIALLAASAASARTPETPTDAIVYLKGGDVPPSTSQLATSQATFVFKRIGLRLIWRAGEPPTKDLATGLPVIRVAFTNRTPRNEHPGALAYATPFAGDSSLITVMYDRLKFAAVGRSGLEAALLAHVLAHEIGHILLRTDAHTDTGIMKARWFAEDFDAMLRKPLAFMPADVEIMHQHINMFRLRSAAN